MTLDPAVDAPALGEEEEETPEPDLPLAAPRKARRRGRSRSALNVLAALIVSGTVLYASFFPAGPLPALGPAFNPATGAWTMAQDAVVGTQTLRLAGLEQPARVTLERDGTAHIVAQTDHDLFLATGYVHARFRLFQMDLLRRQGEGRLSEVVGKAALESDRFELQLGLLRTAETEWAALAPAHRSHQALSAYAQGVNDRIDEAVAQHQLPAMFTLLGYQPKHWTPIDSLIVKGDMTQTLNFTDTPLVMALLQKSLGPDLTDRWFPILPPNQQSPYDVGPYPTQTTVAPIATMATISDAQATASADAYQRLASLPAGLIATGGASNNWAVAGAKSESGGSLMAGDPHLHLTLPAIWFQMSIDSPGYHASGVGIPGTPVVLIGHNQHISWSLTDAQNQQTFYYAEKEDSSRPGEYFWNGGWQKYKTAGYDIPVLGGATEHLTVKMSVHGPVITERGQTMSVWWAGNIPSQDLDVLLGIDQAGSYQAFREALRGWYSPTHNFVYADDFGNIGLISAGYYPQVARGEPWLPMPGTGEYDVTGTIPYDEIPQAFNPPDHIIWSANQRQVTAEYPYYIGTTSNLDRKLTAADMAALQTDTRDFLASEITPVLLEALSGGGLSKEEEQASLLLARWDYRMETDSAAATIWWNFWQSYLAATFDPYWKSRDVKVARSELNDALSQDLEAWTLNDQHNLAFMYGGTSNTAVEVMRIAFHSMFSALTKQLGADPSTWTWGKVHQRELENLVVSGLNYGPKPDRGDAYTPLAAPDFPSTHGPSWRMVVDWGAKTFQGIYPGGQSENPVSQWYADRAGTWWKGDYAPMLTADQAATSSGSMAWSLKP